MESLKIRSRVDADGVVRLQVPVELANSEIDLVVVYQTVEKSRESKESKTATELGYPEDFFDSTFGCWEGEPLTRGEQGECDQRRWDLL
ncbi:hypothetical protein [Crocosphaera subtropica]|nr:hypothetical protein [Crocosphaera subtropica]